MPMRRQRNWLQLFLNNRHPDRYLHHKPLQRFLHQLESAADCRSKAISSRTLSSTSKAGKVPDHWHRLQFFMKIGRKLLILKSLCPAVQMQNHDFPFLAAAERWPASESCPPSPDRQHCANMSVPKRDQSWATWSLESMASSNSYSSWDRWAGCAVPCRSTCFDYFCKAFTFFPLLILWHSNNFILSFTIFSAILSFSTC